MVTSKVNGVTKHAYSSSNFIYYFAAQIVVVSGDEIQYLYFTDVIPLRFNFSEVTEKYGTKTPEEFCDYLANNGYFLSNTVSENNSDLLTTLNINLRNISTSLSNIGEQNRDIIYLLKSINE